jgi:hypothetical protein
MVCMYKRKSRSGYIYLSSETIPYLHMFVGPYASVSHRDVEAKRIDTVLLKANLMSSFSVLRGPLYAS